MLPRWATSFVSTAAVAVSGMSGMSGMLGLLSSPAADARHAFHAGAHHSATVFRTVLLPVPPGRSTCWFARTGTWARGRRSGSAAAATMGTDDTFAPGVLRL